MSRFALQGKALRERREAMGLSFAEVYEAIHVPIEHLRALEAGNLHALPVATYVQGFLRSYCEYLQLDPEVYLYAFHACRETAPPPKATVRRSVAAAAAPSARPAWLTDVIAWGTVCGLLLLGWFTYSVVVRPFLDSLDTRVEAGTVEITPESPFDLSQ